jgi:hypothetical protein
MIVPEALPLTLWPLVPASSDEDERLDRALEEMTRDQWVNDFMKRLDYLLEDIGRK